MQTLANEDLRKKFKSEYGMEDEWIFITDELIEGANISNETKKKGQFDD